MTSEAHVPGGGPPVLAEPAVVAVRRTPLWRLLLRDPMAAAALVWLLIVAVAAILGSFTLSEVAARVDLGGRNFPPFSFDRGWLYVLGADSLGRSELARLCVGAATTVGIALATATVSLTLGTLLGMIAGYFGGLLGTLIMRVADMILSFPALLLALVVLYVLGPSVLNLVIVLSISRLPVYVRVARAEVSRYASACSSMRRAPWARGRPGSCAPTSCRSSRRRC